MDMVAELKPNTGVHLLKNAMLLKLHAKNLMSLVALLVNKNGANLQEYAKLLDLHVMFLVQMDASYLLVNIGVHCLNHVLSKDKNAKMIMVAELKLNIGASPLKNALPLKLLAKNLIHMVALSEKKNGANLPNNVKLLDLPVMYSE